MAGSVVILKSGLDRSTDSKLHKRVVRFRTKESTTHVFPRRHELQNRRVSHPFAPLCLSRLEIVRDTVDSAGDRNMAGRLRERTRIIAEEAVMFDADRYACACWRMTVALDTTGTHVFKIQIVHQK